MLLKTTLIAVAMTVPAHAQRSQRGITIITPYSVHVYSADPATPGRLLDDENLQRQNERQRAHHEANGAGSRGRAPRGGSMMAAPAPS